MEQALGEGRGEQSEDVQAAGGFAEVDQMGEELQAELHAAIRKSGVRVLGPNTAGHISTPADFTSSFFPLGKLPKGPISYIAQTGNFTGAMMRSIMTGEHYGVARCIGLGNAVDIDEADVLAYLADDDETGDDQGDSGGDDDDGSNAGGQGRGGSGSGRPDDTPNGP